MRTLVAMVAVVALAAACTQEPGASKPVALTLKLDSNMTLGQDFDEFILTIQQDGYGLEKLHGYPDQGWPAFRPIIPGEQKMPHVTVTLVGRLNGIDLGDPLEQQFYIPDNYQDELLLRVPATSKAALQPLGLRPQATDGLVPPAGGFALDLLMDGLCSAKVFTAECAEGETCIAGACRTSSVDITTLPLFGQDGEGSGTSSAECVNVHACFANRRTMDVASDCKMVSPAPHGMTNVAVALEPQAGIGTCHEFECLLPLDYGAPPHGWTRAAEADGGAPLGTDGTIQLDEELCKTALSNGLRGFQRFVVSGDCPTFERSVAPCPPDASGGPDGGDDGGLDGGDDGGLDGGAPPTDFGVTGVEPADGATDVEPNTPIRVTFSLRLDTDNPDDVLTVLHDGAPVEGDVRVDGYELLFDSPQPLALKTRYVVTAAAGIRAENGATLGSAYTSTFTTRDGRWRDATSVSGSPASSPQLVIGPDGHTLIVFEVDGQLQSVRRTAIVPEWTPINFVGTGFNVEGKFLLRSDPVWGAMTVARDGDLLMSSHYRWTDKDWEPVEAIDSSGTQNPIDALVHDGQGWVIYPASSGPRLGRHGAPGGAMSEFPAVTNALSLSADAPGQVTVVSAAPGLGGADAIISEQRFSAPNKADPAAEIARAAGMEIESLRAVGNGTGAINAFWIQQISSGDRSQVMASRRESGVWSTPREVDVATGAFFFDLHVAGNSREEAALTWLVRDLAKRVHLYATSANRSGSAAARELLSGNIKVPKAAIDPDGNGAVVWLNTAGSVGSARLRTDDGSWSAVGDIPGSSGANSEPDVAFDVDGRGWSVWSGAAGVQVSRFE